MPRKSARKAFITQAERDRLSKLAESRTAGPWRLLMDQGTREAVLGQKATDDYDIDPVCQIVAETVWGKPEDLFLMAAAREAIPKLIAEIESLEEEVQKLKAM